MKTPRLAFLFGLLVSAASAVTLSDQLFNPVDWSQTILTATGPAPSLVTGQVAAGGNSGAYRSIDHYYGGPGSIVAGHLFSTAGYDPGVSGAVATVSFSFDARVFDAGDSNAVAFGALLRQDGNYYIAGYSAISTGPWQSLSYNDLAAADFGLLLGGGPATPDFSAGGALIEFGFYSSNGTGIASATHTNSGVDNWMVETVAPTVPDDTPTGALLVVVLACMLRRRRPTVADGD